jgi:hypothetical protein
MFASYSPRYVDAPFRAVVDNFVDILHLPPTTPACAITPSTNIAPQIPVNDNPAYLNPDPAPGTAASDQDAILENNGMGDREVNTEDPGHETPGVTTSDTAHISPSETANLPPLFATSREMITPMGPPAVRVQFPPTCMVAQDNEDLENPYNLIERRHLSDFQSIIRMLKVKFTLYWNSRTSLQQCNTSSNFY